MTTCAWCNQPLCIADAVGGTAGGTRKAYHHSCYARLLAELKLFDKAAARNGLRLIKGGKQ